jgi:predicted ArsR family transcriptional regulator
VNFFGRVYTSRLNLRYASDCAPRAHLNIEFLNKPVDARDYKARRPSALYGLCAGADAQLARAYPSMVSHLVRVLSEELSSQELEKVMEKVGPLFGSEVPRVTGDVAERVKKTVRFLATLGSIAKMTEENGRYVIGSDGCPIGVAVAANVHACSSMQAMTQELTGLTVDKECRYGTRSRCCFVVTPPSIRERRAGVAK